MIDLNINLFFRYCGHGSGCGYISDKVKNPITSPTSLFLIGCQSARWEIDGRSEGSGTIINYLTSGCPSIFGLLWSVDSNEIDGFTKAMLGNWMSNLSMMPNNYRGEFTTYHPLAPMQSFICNKKIFVGHVLLQMMTCLSPIVFGLPVWLRRKE